MEKNKKNINTVSCSLLVCVFRSTVSSTVCTEEAAEALKTDRTTVEDDDAWHFLGLDWLVH